MRQAILDSFPAPATRPFRSTRYLDDHYDGMAAATTPGLYHTAEAAHLDGVDFAGKTGTAQVVGVATPTPRRRKNPNACSTA